MSYLADYGGNSFKLSWFGESSNLHKVWYRAGETSFCHFLILKRDGGIILGYLKGQNWSQMADTLVDILLNDTSIMKKYAPIALSLLSQECYSFLL